MPDIAAIERPQIETFLAEPLLNPMQGLTIREMRHRSAKRRVAPARGVGGSPTIYYSTNIEAQFSPIAFALVRAHVDAHFPLGHVRSTKDADGGTLGPGSVAECEFA